MRHVMLCLFFLAAGNHYCVAQTAFTPVSYALPGSPYLQLFNSLPLSGSFGLTGKGPIAFQGPSINSANLNGWQLLMTGGSNANASFAVSTGSSTGNGVYSLGGTAATDRALGSLSSSTGIYALGLVLTNNTGIPLNTFTVSFTAEQWRKGGSGNTNTWAFSYKTGVLGHMDTGGLTREPQLDMHSVVSTPSAGSLDGNLPQNQQLVSFTVSGINWKNGEQLLLRWDDADEAGSDDVCAIDDFSFTAQQLSMAPSITGTAATGITVGSALLSGTVNDNFSNTNIVFEYDTISTFPGAIAMAAVPSTIDAGSGQTLVSALLGGLPIGVTVYFRIKAINTAGTVTGTAFSFTTAFSAPVVTSSAPTGISTSTAVLGGSISSTGGAAIIDKGIVWSLQNDPTVPANKINMGSGTGNFMHTITGLPQGVIIYARAYATNQAGIGYGQTETFTTQTLLISLNTVSSTLTNTATVPFLLKTAQPVTGLSASHFTLSTTGNLTGAFITGLTGSANSFTITVYTGTGDGSVRLCLQPQAQISPPIFNLPFTATGFYTIDKTPPLVRSVTIPGKPMKIGDTVAVTISVQPDTATYTTVMGNIYGKTISALVKKNDSVYTSAFIITGGSADIAAAAAIPVSIAVTDPAGNTGPVFQSPIIQPSDPIDANRPYITALATPLNKVYKTGDILDFIFRFSEKIAVNAATIAPTLSLTIATKTKAALYASGNLSDSIVFRYIVQPGDADKDGIRIGSSITLNGAMVTDTAGNSATLIFAVPATKDIVIDAVAPAVTSVTVPPAAMYKTGNILDFLVNYSKKVLVDNTQGDPSLTIIIGVNEKQAIYTGGSGSQALLFRYIVEDDDMDKDGIKLISPLILNEGTIRDEPGNTASLNVSSIGALSNIRINPVTAAVSSVSVPEPGVYKTGDTVFFATVFTEKVNVSLSAGIPSLKFTIGNASKHAFYQEGTGSNTLVFLYAIQPGDEDSNGLKMNANISLNNGSIMDARGNPVPLSLHNMGNTAGILVDAVPPSVRHVATPGKNMHKTGDTLNFTVNFTEKVFLKNVYDTPFLQLLIGPAIKRIHYQYGSGSSAFLFRYIIQNNDLDKNGIKLDSMMVTGNNIATDAAGNHATLNLKNIGALSQVKIDAVAPVFLSDNTTVHICENATAVSIAEALAVKDEEAGELLSWQVIPGGSRGTVTKPVSTATSNGNTLTPAGIHFKPLHGYTGNDTLTIRVSDGVNNAEKLLVLTIQPAIQNNTIGPGQVSCPGNTPAPITGSTPSGGDGMYRLAWEVSTGAEPGVFSKATGNNHLPNYGPSPLSATSWFRRKVESGACTDVSGASQVMVVKSGLWTGDAGTDWENPHNWCNGMVPDAATDVFIYGNSLHKPEIKGNAACNRLSILNNAQVLLTGVLQVKADLIVASGNIEARNGTLVLDGAVPQQIPADLFNSSLVQNLVLNNPAGISLSGPLSVSGKLLLHSGWLITNDHLALQHTAKIGASANGTAVIGNTRIAYRIPATGKKTFRLLGHPFANDLALSQLTDSIAADPPPVFRHDAAKTNDSLGMDAGWIPFTHTGGLQENTWKEFTGIRLATGTIGYTHTPALLSFSGKVHTGDQEIVLSNGTYAVYHLVSNPYPSPVDLSFTTRGSGLGMHYWVWNTQQGLAGGYSSIPFKNSHILPAFGAFVVKATTAADNRLLFTENCKVDALPGDSLAVTGTDDAYHLELRLESDSVFWDRLMLFQVDSARTGYDRNDAEKLRNSEVNFYSLSREQKMLSIDARPFSNASFLPLGIQSDAPRQFTLRVAALHLPSSNTWQLHDAYLDKWMRLEKDSSYSFFVSADTATMGNRRFSLATPKQLPVTYQPAGRINIRVSPVPATDKLIVHYLAPEKANTTIRILDLTGTPLKIMALGVQKEGQAIISIADMLSGIYLLELISGDKKTSKKIIKN